MPATSAAQERLMQAAAHTKGGYGGVSQSVGKEFVSKDAELIRGAGIMLMAPDGRVLFIKRSKDSPHPGSWDFPGGKADDNETPEQTAKRECSEEIGALPYGELKPIYHEPDSEGVEFITYLMHIKQVFTPKLEESEHTKYKWRTLDDPPKNLHPGVQKVVDAQLGTIKDPGPEKPDDIPAQDDFKESEHPRADNWQFGSGVGGSGSGTAGEHTSTPTKHSATHAQDAEHWITSESGSHLLIDGTAGGGYEIKGGAGGKLNGTKVNPKSMSAPRLNEKTSQFNSPDFEPYAGIKNSSLLSDKERNAIAKNNDLRKKYAPDISTWDWKEKARGGEYDHLYDEQKEHEKKIELAKKQESKSKNDAWRAKNLPKLVAQKNERIEKERKDQEARIAKAKEWQEIKSLPRSYLNVPYAEKEDAKKHGAKWDADKRSWFFPGGGDIPDGLQKYIRNKSPSASPSKSTRHEQSIENRQTNKSFIDTLPKYGTVSADDPSVYGSWLLGHEGESWSRVRLYAPNRKITGDSVSDDGDYDDMTPLDDISFAQDAAMAFDKASVRTYDEDGRMHVEITNISKANICEYYGSEIPDEDGTLNLIPGKLYKLLRDPDELAAGADTFNNLPVLSEHVSVSATDHKPDLVVGSTGTDAVFESPYLKNSMVIWSQKYIDGVESGEQQEISCAYRYVPDMTPGEYDEKSYDGVMRNIRGNHIAVVNKGRAGPDVVVGDSLTKESKPQMSKTLSTKATMAKGALLAVLKPKMAADAMPNLDAILQGVKKSNWHAKKPGIIAAMKQHMAADADVSALVQLLDSLDGADKPAEDEQDDNLGQDDKSEGILAMLRGKISDEDLAAVEKALKSGAPAEDEEEDPMGAQDNPPPTPGTPAPPAVGTAEAPVSKTAMDAAIKAATKQAEQRTIDRLRGVSEAEKFVAPYVGELAIAQDSAEGVYNAALGILGVDVAGIHPSAFKAVLAAHTKPGAVRVAQDAAPTDGFATQFPDAGRIRKI